LGEPLPSYSCITKLVERASERKDGWTVCRPALAKKSRLRNAKSTSKGGLKADCKLARRRSFARSLARARVWCGVWRMGRVAGWREGGRADGRRDESRGGASELRGRKPTRASRRSSRGGRRRRRRRRRRRHHRSTALCTLVAVVSLAIPSQKKESAFNEVKNQCPMTSSPSFALTSTGGVYPP